MPQPSLSGMKGRKPYWIVAVYALASALWIAFSDRALESLELPTRAMTLAQTFKGWFFVALSSLLIWALLKRHESMQAGHERMLLESERKFRKLFEDAPMGLFRTDPDGRFLEMNKKLAEMLGYGSPKEALEGILNLTTDLYAHPEDRAKVIEHIRQQPGDIVIEREFKRRNGEVFTGRVRARYIPAQGNTPAIVEGAAEDVTEIKRHEQEAILLRNLLASVVDAMPSALAGVDAAGKIILWNRGAEDVFDLGRDQALGRTLTEVMPDVHQEMELVLTAIANRETRRLTRRKRVRRSVPVAEDVTIYPFDTGETTGAVLRFDDVSEQVRMEELLIQNEKMLSVGELAAGMAHEINNPLGGIAQSAQVILRRLSDQTEASRRSAEDAGCPLQSILKFLESRQVMTLLSSIREEAFKAAKVVNSLISFTAGGSSTKSATNLAALMDEALEMAARDYGLAMRHDFRNLTITRHYAPDLPSAWVNPSEMVQVFIGLIRNAAQALSGGTCDGKTPEITLTIAVEDSHAVIRVRDNGPGMDETTRRRVFEPFFSTKPPGEGTGLGLSVAYFIVSRNHQGTITVVSKPGQGTAFTILLPLTPLQSGQGDSATDRGLPQ